MADTTRALKRKRTVHHRIRTLFPQTYECNTSRRSSIARSSSAVAGVARNSYVVSSSGTWSSELRVPVADQPEVVGVVVVGELRRVVDGCAESFPQQGPSGYLIHPS